MQRATPPHDGDVDDAMGTCPTTINSALPKVGGKPFLEPVTDLPDYRLLDCGRPLVCPVTEIRRHLHTRHKCQGPSQLSLKVRRRVARWRQKQRQTKCGHASTRGRCIKRHIPTASMSPTITQCSGVPFLRLTRSTVAPPKK